MTTDLDALEALAKAAAPGPWFASRTGKRYEEGHHVWSKREPEEPDSHDIATYCWGQEEAEFIAAANPSTVLALIAELRQERERADEANHAAGRHKSDAAYWENEYETAEDMKAELRTALSRAEETIDRIDGEVKNFEQSDNDALCEIERHLTAYGKQKGVSDA